MSKQPPRFVKVGPHSFYRLAEGEVAPGVFARPSRLRRTWGWLLRLLRLRK